MGLIGKLINKSIDAMVDSLNASKAKSQELNPVEKRYYDDIVFLLRHIDNAFKENIKTYFKAKYNEDCDDAILDKVLERFIASSDYGETWYSLSAKQYSEYVSGKIVPTAQEKEKIYQICFSEYSKEVKTRFETVYDLIKDKPTVYQFDKNYKRVFEVQPINVYSAPHYSLGIKAKIAGEEITKRLFACDPTAVALARECALFYLRMHVAKRNTEYVCFVYSFALHAINFLNNIKNGGQYTTVTQQDCRNVVLNSAQIQREIEQDPLAKDIIINSYTQDIFDTCLLFNQTCMEWQHWAYKDVRFVDAACCYAFLEIKKHYEAEELTPEMAARMINDYAVKKYSDNAEN